MMIRAAVIEPTAMMPSLLQQQICISGMGLKGSGNMSGETPAIPDETASGALSPEVAAIAHDFRNMLQCATSAVTVAANRLKRGREGQVADLLGDALAALDRAGALAQRLVFKQSAPAQRGPVSIGQTIADLTSILRHAVGPKIYLKTAIAEDLPAIAGDRADLENVLLNVAINAREAMPHGGRLFIKASNCLLPCNFSALGRPGVKLSISDTGCGMAPELRAHVLTQAASTKGNGRGIGLTTIGKFARKLGGTFELESVPHGGTCIKISVPVFALHPALNGSEAGDQ
jgi:signal transduction histidine kinase